MRDGEREVLARLELPLPMTLAAELMRGIAELAEELGYTDVRTDSSARISGIPPAPGGDA